MINAHVLGTGAYAPKRVLTNQDLAEMVDTTDAWITGRTGIKQRRIAAEGEVTSDMAVIAARHALAMAGTTAEDLDMIIVATVSADMPLPSCAVIIQAKLGATKAFAFDVSAACAGSLYGLNIAAQFIKTGQARRVLVIGAELLSRLVDWSDRNTCVLFGDAAGAMVVGPGAWAGSRHSLDASSFGRHRRRDIDDPGRRQPASTIRGGACPQDGQDRHERAGNL